MIPKIIHWCWFGTAPLPEEFRTYIAKWHEIMPDYEFMEWNDSNLHELDDSIDARGMKVIEWCYMDRKRLSFLSDYVRVTVLEKYGGFYFDTDVEVFKPFDVFLNERNVFGYIFDALVGTAVVGAEKGSEICKELKALILDIFEEKGELSVNNDYVTQYLMDREGGGSFSTAKTDGMRTLPSFAGTTSKNIPRMRIRGILGTTAMEAGGKRRTSAGSKPFSKSSWANVFTIGFPTNAACTLPCSRKGISTTKKSTARMNLPS